MELVLTIMSIFCSAHFLDAGFIGQPTEPATDTEIKVCIAAKMMRDETFRDCIYGGMSMADLLNFNTSNMCQVRATEDERQRASHICLFEASYSCSRHVSIIQFLFLQHLEATITDQELNITIPIPMAFDIFCEGLSGQCDYSLCETPGLTFDGVGNFFDNVLLAVPRMIDSCRSLQCVIGFGPTCPQLIRIAKLMYLDNITATINGIQSMSQDTALQYTDLVYNTCAKVAEMNQSCISTNLQSPEVTACIAPYTAPGTGANTSCTEYIGLVTCLDTTVGQNCNQASVDVVIAAARFLDVKLPFHCHDGRYASGTEIMACVLEKLETNVTLRSCVLGGMTMEDVIGYNTTQQCLIRTTWSSEKWTANICLFENAYSCSRHPTLASYIQMDETMLTGFDLDIRTAIEIQCENVTETCDMLACAPINELTPYSRVQDFVEHVKMSLPTILDVCLAMNCVDALAGTCSQTARVSKQRFMNSLLSKVPDVQPLSPNLYTLYKEMTIDLCQTRQLINSTCISTELSKIAFIDCVAPYKSEFGSNTSKLCLTFDVLVSCLQDGVGNNCNDISVVAVIAAARYADGKLPFGCALISGSPPMTSCIRLVLMMLISPLLCVLNIMS